jgi:hypothetical protein
VLAVGVAILAVVLAGCTGAPVPPATSASPTSTASASPTPTSAPPRAPVLVPDGSALDNLPLFAAVTAKVWAGADRTAGRAYIDALVAAGFEKSAMQVTRDTSTVGNPAESIQFSVRWKDGQCLVGQVGPATGNPVTEVLPGLGDGRCLLGDTRPIDW